MSKDNKARSVANVNFRHGEGHTVDVTVVSVKGGESYAGLELGTLPVPDRRFASDDASIVAGGEMVRLLFAQKHPVGEGLLSLLVINITHESVAQFIETISSEFEANARTLPGATTAKQLSTFSTKADQTMVLAASFILAGFTGNDACIDFFYSSPFAHKQMSVFKKLSIEPIVRVNLPTVVLVAMINALKRLTSTTNGPSAK